ncbi:hypothetical protein HMPREF1864_01253 [Peptoniphilus sp. DNF00840]|nr:hypothetical protein HMPREF1864_01253 [Peptoniphilus sp. DNF00840]
MSQGPERDFLINKLLSCRQAKIKMPRKIIDFEILKNFFIKPPKTENK